MLKIGWYFLPWTPWRGFNVDGMFSFVGIPTDKQRSRS